MSAALTIEVSEHVASHTRIIARCTHAVGEWSLDAHLLSYTELPGIGSQPAPLSIKPPERVGVCVRVQDPGQSQSMQT